MGCASIAERLVVPAIKQIPAIELVAIASRDAEKAVKYAAMFGCEAVCGYEELLRRQDIHAIYMPLPTGLHFSWAMKALDAGKHVFLEKSLASNYSQARKLIAKAKKKQLLIKENYMFEYHAQQAIVRNLIRTRLGVVRIFRASFGFPPLEPANFRYDPQLGGGALLDAGGYVLKAGSVFFPTHTAQVLSANLNYGGCMVDIAGSAMLSLNLADESISSQIAFGFDHHYQCKIEVWGSSGILTTNRTFTAGPGFVPKVQLESAHGTELISLPSDNHFIRILEHFVKVVNEQRYDCEYLAILRQAQLQDSFRRAALAKK